jgi:hypothetical protein
VCTPYTDTTQEHPMSNHINRQQVNLTVTVADNDLIRIETGEEGEEGGITINYEESECLRTLLANAWYELVERRRGGPGEDMQPFPVKEIELS